jgi:hypothetical protein
MPPERPRIPSSLDDLRAEDVARGVKDAFYVTVGLGVLAYQRAQVQRKELRQRFGPQLEEARGQLQSLAKLIEEQMKVVEQRLDSGRKPG